VARGLLGLLHVGFNIRITFDPKELKLPAEIGDGVSK